MNAWIDCMSYLDSPKSEMSQITLMPGQLLLITVQESKLFQQNMPTMFDSLTQCTAVVNRHFADRQSKVRIGLIFE